MAELVDAWHSKCHGSNPVRVQVSPSAPKLTLSEITAPRGLALALALDADGICILLRKNAPQEKEVLPLPQPTRARATTRNFLISFD